MEDVKNCFNVEISCLLLEKFDEMATKRKKNILQKPNLEEIRKAFVNKITLAQQDRRLAVANITETKTAPISFLLHLPEVVLLDIFRYVSIADICNLRLTCRYVNIICASNYLWKFLLEQFFL